MAMTTWKRWKPRHRIEVGHTYDFETEDASFSFWHVKLRRVICAGPRWLELDFECAHGSTERLSVNPSTLPVRWREIT